MADSRRVRHAAGSFGRMAGVLRGPELAIAGFRVTAILPALPVPVTYRLIRCLTLLAFILARPG